MKTKHNTLTAGLATMVLVILLFFSYANLCLAQSMPPWAFAKGTRTAGNRTVASATLSAAGSGYTSLPTVAFTGGNATTQATATATLKAVGSVTIAAGGSSYTVGDVLTLVGGTKTTTATFTVSTVSTGAVTAVTITNAGVYTVPVTASGSATTGGTGTGCTLTVGWGVGSLVITNGGTGYHTTVPTIAFTGGGGSSAAFTAVFASQAAVSQPFNGFMPMEDTVIAAITTYSNGDVTTDAYLSGKTYYKGVWYPIQGNAVTLTSGYLLLSRR